MANKDRVIGFIGLGQMGGPMAANIAKAGFKLVCYDNAGTDALKPEGATACPSIQAVVEQADTIFLSLPDGAIVNQVAEEIAAVANPRADFVIDLSTIGPDASRRAAQTLAARNIAFGDAPVSGGRSGAIKGTITLIFSGDKARFDEHMDVFNAFCGNPFHVGDEAGQGQALKLLNNFLSATAMAATSEAIVYGLSQGLDMNTMLDVVNVSTGANTASQDKFPNRVLTGTFDAGFFAELLNKDVQLYIDNVRNAKTPADVGEAVSAIWQQGTDQFAPKTDFTNIYKFIRDHRGRE
jgi:3-hydroxyisobutyrate dehydrogenase